MAEKGSEMVVNLLRMIGKAVADFLNQSLILIAIAFLFAAAFFDLVTVKPGKYFPIIVSPSLIFHPYHR